MILTSQKTLSFSLSHFMFSIIYYNAITCHLVSLMVWWLGTNTDAHAKLTVYYDNLLD
jgi:hypothetical protein